MIKYYFNKVVSTRMIVVLTVVGGLFGLYYNRGRWLNADPPPKVVEQIGERFGITIFFENFPEKSASPHGQIGWRKAELAELEPYFLLLESGLSIYDVDIIRKSKIERIILCKQLKLNDRPASGIAGFDHNTLYLDVVAGNFNREFQITNLHHEIYHMIDYNDDMNIYEDSKWSSFNKKDFSYNKNRESFEPYQDGYPSKIDGFLTNYSTTALEEDKAETYSILITNRVLLEQRAEVDPIIKQKK